VVFVKKQPGCEKTFTALVGQFESCTKIDRFSNQEQINELILKQITEILNSPEKKQLSLSLIKSKLRLLTRLVSVSKKNRAKRVSTLTVKEVQLVQAIMEQLTKEIEAAPLSFASRFKKKIQTKTKEIGVSLWGLFNKTVKFFRVDLVLSPAVKCKNKVFSIFSKKEDNAKLCNSSTENKRRVPNPVKPAKSEEKPTKPAATFNRQNRSLHLKNRSFPVSTQSVQNPSVVSKVPSPGMIPLPTGMKGPPPIGGIGFPRSFVVRDDPKLWDEPEGLPSLSYLKNEENRKKLVSKYSHEELKQMITKLEDAIDKASKTIDQIDQAEEVIAVSNKAIKEEREKLGTNKIRYDFFEKNKDQPVLELQHEEGCLVKFYSDKQFAQENEKRKKNKINKAYNTSVVIKTFKRDIDNNNDVIRDFQKKIDESKKIIQELSKKYECEKSKLKTTIDVKKQVRHRLKTILTQYEKLKNGPTVSENKPVIKKPKETKIIIPSKKELSLQTQNNAAINPSSLYQRLIF